MASDVAKKARAWAGKQPPKKSGGVPCWVCANPSAREATDELLQLRDEGSPLSYKQIVDYLRSEFKCPFGGSVIANHNTHRVKP